MSTLQQVYRELRRYLTREDARYAAPRLVALRANGGLGSVRI